MQELYGRLRSRGYPRKFIQSHVLPSWWDDEAAASSAGLLEATFALSRNLGLDPASLRTPGQPISLLETLPRRLKKAADTDEHDVELTVNFAIQVARLVSATARAKLPTPATARDIRDAILGSGAPWIGLEELLEYCWTQSIPVVHLGVFPPNSCKVDGLAAKVPDGSAIVLCRNDKSKTIQLFILAHELGHIMCGHLGAGGAIIDGDVQNETRDDEENQADAFAVELLTGEKKFITVAAGRWPKADHLAAWAQQTGTSRHIYPGLLAANYGHSMPGNFWGVARAAQNKLESGVDARDVIRSKMNAGMDWEALPEDTAEFLARVTLAGVAHAA